MMEVKMEVRWDRLVGPWAGAGTEFTHRLYTQVWWLAGSSWRQHAQQPAPSTPSPLKRIRNCVFAVKR